MAIDKRFGTALGVAGVLVAALAVSGTRDSAHGTGSGDRCEQKASACSVWNSPDNPGFPRLPQLIMPPRGGVAADGR